jgi:hypothetical protein
MVSVGTALGQTSGKAVNAVWTADEAWEKVYSAKDLAKSVRANSAIRAAHTR